MKAWTTERRLRDLVIALAVIFAMPASAAPKERVKPEWKRDPKAAVHREDAPPPAVPDLPAELRLPPPEASAPRVEASRGPGTPGAGSDVDGLAVRAAGEVAIEAARVWGWRQYWRAGFARGARVGLEDSRLGGWDRAEGFRFGRLDPRARDLGEQIAAEAAGPDALRAANDQVRDQFGDLAHEPRNDPRARAPRFAPDGPWADAPPLDDVVGVFPLSATPGLSRPAREAIESWDDASASFARGDRGGSGYDAAWKDPIVAFGAWRDRQRSGSYWSRFTTTDKERFRGVFCDRFGPALAALDLRPTYAGWSEGFEDGWRYGAAVRAEWNYRQGYAEGFDLGVREVASTAYPYAFERAYAGAYASAFEDWERNPHPALGGVRLTDESGDGVFEPGERLTVEPELINYGGAPGQAALRAAGGDLDGDASMTVRLPARGRAALDRPLIVTVGSRTPVRTRTAVTLTLGDASAEVPLYVSRPLAISGDPEIDADRLAGRVSLTVALANTSRRDVRAMARVSPKSGPGDPQEKDLGIVRAGRSATATFTYDGFAPLDLIAGDARFEVSVARGADADDVAAVAVPAVATDLASHDLVDYMIQLARSPRAARRDQDRARDLMLDRMRADWEHAVAADGNPYKRDLETHGADTALGDLVRSVEAERRSFASRSVFDGLGDRIDALADDLPGAHPLLRKWMKKLAKRVG